MDTKCFGCGLVNWQGATECARCKVRLGVRPVTTLNPFEGEIPKKISGVRLFLMLAVTAIGSFSAYQFVKPDVPIVKLPTKEQIAQQKEMFEIEQRQAEKDRQFSKSIDMPQGLSKTKYDFRNLPPVIPNGMYTPPPPGTVYSQDKYGQMHQVR